jgi:hypothetical protein
MKLEGGGGEKNFTLLSPTPSLLLGDLDLSVSSEATIIFYKKSNLFPFCQL